MRFYLGTHRPHWLGLTDVPLFISRRRLENRSTFPRALGPWALDSGGFTELRDGGWSISPEQYAETVQLLSDAIGRMDWAAPQDWMCEPEQIAATGLSVEEHQHRTVENLLVLREIAPAVQWTPVLQGYTIADYWRCVGFYERAGVDLAREPLVGLGSVCRRSATGEIAALIAELAEAGFRLHGFGVKLLALRRASWSLVSADSMAWSFAGRVDGNKCGGPHKACNNCIDWAMMWRAQVLEAVDRPQQHSLLCQWLDHPPLSIVR